MAVKFLKNSKDSFVDSSKPNNNFGLDEILEMGVKNTNSSIRKILIGFDSNEINYLKTNFSGSSNSTSLKLFLASSYNLPSSYSVELYELSDSNWVNGVGKVDNNYYSIEGINYANYQSQYQVNKRKISEDFFSIYSNKDLTLNLSGSITYSYLLNIKNDSSLVLNQDFSLNYFSKDTNTIYSPKLLYKFDDSIYNLPVSGSIINETFNISMANNLEKFKTTGKYRINLSARDTNPTRSFINKSIFSQKKYLPSTSFFAIRDIKTGVYLINFDENFTKVSLDNKGNYFTLYTENIEPNRYYAIDLKVRINNFDYLTFDNLIFKLFD